MNRRPAGAARAAPARAGCGLALRRQRGRMLPAGLVTAMTAALLLSACQEEARPADAAQQRNASVEQPTIARALARLPEFSMVRRALRQTALWPALAATPTTPNPAALSPAGPANAASGSVTLLAPRDTAFARLTADQRAALFSPAAQASLRAGLRGMILPRMIRAAELRSLIIAGGGTASLPSLAGPALRFSQDGEQLIVTAPNGAQASMGTLEIGTGNGAIYVLDQWIGPVPAATGAP